MNETVQMEKDDEIEIDLLEIFHVLRRKAAAIIACFLIGAIVVGGATMLFITPQYSASSMIYILTKTTSVTSLADIQMGAQLTVDFQTLATSRPVIENVIEDLDLDYTYNEVVEMVTTENPTNTRILELTVENPDPEMAKDISNSLAEATADRVAEVMSTDKPSIVERAVAPKNPSSPSLVKNTAIGALLGAFLAIALVVVQYLLNDTIQNEEDVTKYLGINTLAAMPLEKRR